MATYPHVFWECPSCSQSFVKVAKCPENIQNFPIPKQPTLVLFNDSSVLSDSTRLALRRIIFAGLTAAEKTITHS